MRIEFSEPTPFDCQDEETYRSLRSVFEEASRERHQVLVDDYDALMASGFFRWCASPADQELIRRTANQARNQPTAPVRAQVKPAGEFERHPRGFEVPAQRAGVWAQQPLRVLLENHDDKLLIQIAAYLLGGEVGHRIEYALSEGWLVADGQSGTGELQKAVARATNEERWFAVFDSDRKERHVRASAKVQKIIDECGNRHVPYHCLEGQEMENYLPVGWFFAEAGQHTRKRRSAGLGSRPLLFGKLARWVESDRERWNRDFGRAVVDKALTDLRQIADKQVDRSTLWEQAEGLRQLSEADRMVDDLKTRFGEPIAKALVARMRESLDANPPAPPAATDFSQLQQADLQKLAQRLDEWL